LYWYSNYDTKGVMKRAVDPLVSNLSGAIARTNPLEGGPEFEAMFNHGVISTTKSHHLSILMDRGDYEVDEALSVLDWSMDDIREPGIFLPDTRAFDSFHRSKMDDFRDEARTDLTIEVKRLKSIVDIVMTGYMVGDQEEADTQADQIQADIREASDQYTGPTSEMCIKEDDHEGLKQYTDQSNAQAVRCMERDALNSGVRMNAAEFVATMLNITHVLDPERPSELWKVWVSAIENTIDRIWRDAVKPDPPISKLIADRSAFKNMKDMLEDTYRQEEETARARWALMQPAFLTKQFNDAPIMTGSDRSEETIAWRISQGITSNGDS
jgi:hypothetical protein